MRRRQGTSVHVLEPRGLTREEAANFFGLSLGGFDKNRREGKIPGPTLPGGRYDRVLLEETMNKMSGIDGRTEKLSPLDEWIQRRGTGKS